MADSQMSTATGYMSTVLSRLVSSGMENFFLSLRSRIKKPVGCSHCGAFKCSFLG